MGQLWATSTQGGYLYSPLLTKEVVAQAQPDMKLHQFCQLREAWGKGAGETFLFDKYGNIDTQGGTLTETSTIPARGHRYYQSTCTLYEWGNSIPFTRKYETLSQVGARQPVVTALKNDYAKVIDTAVEAQFDACQIRYVGTATAGGEWTTDGTFTATNTNISMTTFHVKEIIDYMYATLNCEPWDGDNYMCVCAMAAKRDIYDDVEDILQYTKYPASGEFGRYYDTRFVKTNHALSNTEGKNSNIGEAYFFGAGGGPVLEGVAVSPEVIPKEVTDYGRSRGLAWYAIMGYKIFWSADPDNNIVKWGSA
jgi:N4-gp56 family major capsid protein